MEGGNKEDKSKQHIGHHGHHGQNPALRRPYHSSSFGYTTNTEHNQEEKKFMLSPQAAEFVPRVKNPFLSTDGGYSARSSKISVQNRLQMAREGAQNMLQSKQPVITMLCGVSENNILEQSFQQQCAMGDSETRSQNGYKNNKDNLKDSKEKIEIEEPMDVGLEIYNHLNVIINTLTTNPAEFTDLVPSFVNYIRKLGNMSCLHMILKTIIEGSIIESNFRYSGARFCKHFASTANESLDQCMFSKSLFQDLLYTQCKLETLLYEPDCENHHMEEYNQRRCNGLILFLAELVAQMDEPYAFLLGELLVQFISKILKKPGVNSVKYICQALKLAGYVLEKDKSRSKDMENMMRALTELVNNGQVDKHVGNMVSNVHELRKDWGKNVSYDSSGKNNLKVLSEMQQQPGQTDAPNYTPETNNPVAPNNENQVDQAVFYGPDGLVLSVDEERFLRETQTDLATSDEEDVDEHYNEEMAIAYEEHFLKDLPKEHQNKN